MGKPLGPWKPRPSSLNRQPGSYAVGTVQNPITKPSDVAGLTGWWADSFSLIGLNIITWGDLSGNGRDLPGFPGFLPTATLGALNGHDVATFTPGGEAGHTNPHYFKASAFRLHDLISPDAYYVYSLVNIVDIKTDGSGDAAFADEAIFADNGGCCEQALKKTGTLVLAANFGGNVDPVNGEVITTPIATGAWQIVTTRHVDGMIGVRTGTGSTFTETASGSTDTAGLPMVGANWAENRGIHGQVAVLATFNRALTPAEDAGVLAYLTSYGAL